MLHAGMSASQQRAYHFIALEELTLETSEEGPNSVSIRLAAPKLPSPLLIRMARWNPTFKSSAVVAHCCGNTNMTYLQGAGNGAFSPEVDFNGGPSPDLVQVADLNGDGALDLVAGSGAGASGTIARAVEQHAAGHSAPDFSRGCCLNAVGLKVAA